MQLRRIILIASIAAVSCARDPNRMTAAHTPPGRLATFTEWARGQLHGVPRVTVLGTEVVPGTECFEAQTAGGNRRVSACVHATHGLLTGRDGYARWLTSRGFHVGAPATGPELLARAFDLIHSRPTFVVQRAWSRAEGAIRILEFDGDENGRRFGRAVEIGDGGVAEEGPTDRMSELDAPTGEFITRFRTFLGPRTDTLTIFRHLSDFDTTDLHCFQAYEGEHIPPQDSGASACIQGDRVLAGPQGVSDYLRARGFTPETPVIDPRKFLVFVSLFTSNYDDYTFTDVRSSIVDGVLEIRADARPAMGRSARRVTRILRLTREFTFNDAWIPFEGGDGGTGRAPLPGEQSSPQHAITPPGQ